jgi:hypothetical protein
LRWSPSDSEIAFIREQVALRRPTPEIALALKVDPNRVSNWLSRHSIKRPRRLDEAPIARPKDVHDVLQLPPAPFAVPLPQKAPAVIRKWRRSLVFGDTHFPFQDDAALAVVLGIGRDVQPHTVVHVGDLLDCYKLSRFSKDPNRIHGLQDEIDMARRFLWQVRESFPSADCWWLEGNHEDRLRKTIWDLPGGGAELARLTAFRRAMTWPAIMELDAIAWRFVEGHAQTRNPIIPKLITKHGTVVRKWSAMSGKGEWERYGKGGISGHTHRLGKFYHSDHNGAHLWTESGCTCTTSPEYMVDPDWQQGCLVVTHTEDGERYAIEEVYVQDGRAVWRGQMYDGNQRAKVKAA